ncbi:hypothetical protein [Paractinoplanes atraurantiacus]|uniref:Uncharacterized protein n=1 Tax=Paractinoplanes atraurantiacus TaxID=1036182 RepID=A0A285GZS3_9ACTN|nr:hypothetical protein [Actinoplanes atraurantiacus]SNY29079.1 hypothetical protein SAMN05421748_103188 [Actinoplanes atraurantiacus]
MAFPQTPLPITVWAAPGNNPADPTTWAWSEISGDVREADGVEIVVGRQDETSKVDATQVGLTLDNRTGKYSPRNPAGTWYGQLAKGTPIQVRVRRIADTFTRTTSNGFGTDPDSGLTWTAPQSASLQSTNGSAAIVGLTAANQATQSILPGAAADDVDVTSVASLSAVTTGAAWVHGTLVRWVDTGNYYRLHTEFTTAGTIACKIVRSVNGSGTDLSGLISTGLAYSAGTKIRTRVQAIGPLLRIKVWLDGTNEPTAWTAQVSDAVLTGQATGLLEWRISGNTNVGTLTATIDDVTMSVIRASTPVPEWPVRWDMTATNVTAPITGNGILRRLSQGQSALRSPLYRQLSALSPHGYWPLEDGSGATSGAATTPNTDRAIQTGVEFGSSEAPPGSAASVTLSTAVTSRITAKIRTPIATATGYAGMAFFRFGSVPASSQNLIRFSTTGRVRLWQLTATPTTIGLAGADDTGALVVSTAAVHGLDYTKWFALQLETEEVGGNTNWALIFHQVGSGVFTAINGSYAGTADTIWGWAATAPVDDTSLCHVWLGSNALPFVDTTFLAVANGYAGELASDRIARLAAEAGIPMAITPGASESMGAQKSATVLDLLRECEDADQGVLFERGAGLGYLPRTARYITANTTPAMALDFASGHIAAPPEPTDDDQQLRNSIRLSRTDGSSAPAAQDAASIAVSGTYEDELTVNVQYDAVLEQHAYWRLHLGTLSELRWPRIELKLHRNPSLIAAWCKVRIGSRITIANPPSAVAGGALDLIVEGWTERLSTFAWDVTLVCSPAEAWRVGAYDDGVSRYDSATTTLKTGVAAGATSLVFRTTNLDVQWSTTHEPYDVLIAGERMTVTNMAAAALVSGAWEQTATVTRSVNGVSKALTAGAEIHIATPGRWAL